MTIPDNFKEVDRTKYDDGYHKVVFMGKKTPKNFIEVGLHDDMSDKFYLLVGVIQDEDNPHISDVFEGKYDIVAVFRITVDEYQRITGG